MGVQRPAKLTPTDPDCAYCAEGIAPPWRDSFQLANLAASKFRSRFKLADADRAYVARMRGHPVFIAQHATATCCRGCLFKWHHIPAGRPLSDAEVEHVVSCLLAWIREKAGDLSGFPVQTTLPI